MEFIGQARPMDGPCESAAVERFSWVLPPPFACRTEANSTSELLMLLSIQFPFADSRKFVATQLALLGRPGWPSPFPDYEFVRSFGSIRVRRRGGIRGWLGESEICEARRALRFNQIPTLMDPQTKSRTDLRCAFRRFYFDGLAVGKFEVAIANRVRKTLAFEKQQTRSLINHFLSLSVAIRDDSGKHESCELGEANKQLVRLYLACTLKTNSISLPLEKWWVLPGSPLLFLEHESNEHFRIPFKIKKVRTPSHYGLELSHCWVLYKSKLIRLWVLSLGSNYNPEQVRTLRLYLHRLHAEHECLKLVLRNIAEKRIDLKARTEASDNLQFYLNRATTRIARYESRSGELIEGELAEFARESEDTISPGQRDALLQRLEILDIRKNVFRKVERYTGNWKDSNTVILAADEITVGEKIVSQENINIHDVIGPVNVKSRLDHVTQTVNNAQSLPGDARAQLTTLLKELQTALEPVEKAQPQDAERVVKTAEMVADEVTKEKPSKSFLGITLAGLSEAAKAVQSIAPAVVDVAGRIASFVGGLF